MSNERLGVETVAERCLNFVGLHDSRIERPSRGYHRLHALTVPFYRVQSPFDTTILEIWSRRFASSIYGRSSCALWKAT